jgi:hypothetical protein
MPRRQIRTKPISPQQVRDLATLKALEAKHQALVESINSLLPMLLVTLPPFVIYSRFSADPSIDFSKLDQTIDFSKLPQSVISAYREAKASVDNSYCKENTDLSDEVHEALASALKIIRQTFKTHKKRCESDLPYRIVCEGPLDELRAYDKFLTDHPKIATHTTHTTLHRNLLQDIRAVLKISNRHFIDSLGYSIGAIEGAAYQSWLVQADILPDNYFEELYKDTMRSITNNDRLLPGARLPFQLRLDTPRADASLTQIFTVFSEILKRNEANCQIRQDLFYGARVFDTLGMIQKEQSGFRQLNLAVIFMVLAALVAWGLYKIITRFYPQGFLQRSHILAKRRQNAFHAPSRKAIENHIRSYMEACEHLAPIANKFQQAQNASMVASLICLLLTCNMSMSVTFKASLVVYASICLFSLTNAFQAYRQDRTYYDTFDARIAAVLDIFYSRHIPCILEYAKTQGTATLIITAEKKHHISAARMQAMIVAALDAHDITYNAEGEQDIAVTGIDSLSAETIRLWRRDMHDAVDTERLAKDIASQLDTHIGNHRLERYNQDDGETFDHYTLKLKRPKGVTYPDTAGLTIEDQDEHYKITVAEMLTDSQTDALAALVDQAAGIKRSAHRAAMTHPSGGSGGGGSKPTRSGPKVMRDELTRFTAKAHQSIVQIWQNGDDYQKGEGAIQRIRCDIAMYAKFESQKDQWPEGAPFEAYQAMFSHSPSLVRAVGAGGIVRINDTDPAHKQFGASYKAKLPTSDWRIAMEDTSTKGEPPLLVARYLYQKGHEGNAIDLIEAQTSPQAHA